ncbi:enolase-phosphatase E1-like isoform X2 [Argiope bruennichi]|uniref:Enolase-phosphatase E1 like protein n=2 Tax=Argiope bruennichi TaxID=94029 RepID=A0A8T0F938_ARGBR|nr:enolase-phosphatase E1-like isoform X2 [Argiope bruennichi]KAF8785513.1 Enolase-phosphatase E1 like protein [Argiope bruennichi]
MDNKVLRKMVSEAKIIILDIEGTIASIDFLRNEAFPLVENQIEDYILIYWEEVKDILSRLRQQSVLDSKESSNDLVQFPSFPTSENTEVNTNYQKVVIDYVKHLMKNKRDDRVWKGIQGFALQKAFRNEDIFAHLYSDAIKALETWSREGKPVYTYSTGSRDTQIEYFRHTIEGDMSEFIKEYFDVSIGSKLECQGYRFICSLAEVNPCEAVFFSDRPKEIVAAKNSGLKAILVDRESKISLIKEEEEFVGSEDGKITSFTEILVDNSND